MRRIDVQASVLPRVWPHDRIARCALYGLDFLFGFLFDICGSMAVSCTRGCVAARAPSPCASSIVCVSLALDARKAEGARGKIGETSCSCCPGGPLTPARVAL